MDDLNHFQAASSPEKLRGQYYTPAALVRRILDRLELSRGDTLLDPACGDGEFLVGAVHHLADRFPSLDRCGAAKCLAGFELNPEAAALARLRVAAALRERFGSSPAEDELRISCRDALSLRSRTEVLAAAGRRTGCGRMLVAGNPPYVEAKRLPAATRLRLKTDLAGASAGAPDLYVYFTFACLDWLEDGDGMAFVLPNKVLVNANAREVRCRLLERRQLQGVDFATQAGLFGAAAVYPVVLYAGPPGSGHGEATLHRLGHGAAGLAVHALPSASYQEYAASEARAFFPTPASSDLASILRRMVDQVRTGRLDDVLEIRWTVSFHRAGLRERYVVPAKPAAPRARPFLGGGAFSGNGEVTRYRIEWGGWWIDYDEEQARADRNPLPPAELFAGPKVVICQNGRTLRAAYDDREYVLKDTFLCGLPRAGRRPLARHPRAVTALLCSRAAHFFCSHVFFGGHVNGGYLHFLRSFLVDLPTGEWTESLAADAASLVEGIENADAESRPAGEEALESLVQSALGLSPEEAYAIRLWAEAEPGWQLRERTRAARPEGAVRDGAPPGGREVLRKTNAPRG